MSKREKLLAKLLLKPMPVGFTTHELDSLMKQCGCHKFEGGRGSGIGYVHLSTNRILQFDGPHPGNELYRYQIKMVIDFLREVGEI
ncbi:MAG: type II toxin-antitoxin system HicA family toxin [Lachnospiraceae bacterium]|nr:type II toxin-antitoxin system HicA family toxin [Lachnospiraceae bacterium]